MIEKCDLEWHQPSPARARENGSVEFDIERLRSNGRERWMHINLIGADEVHQSESSRIVERDHRPGCQFEDDVIVWIGDG